MNYTLLYFASLREAAGRASEQVVSGARDPHALYVEVATRNRFAFAPEHLRVAVNGEFAPWNRTLADGDEIAFLPPVSGG